MRSRLNSSVPKAAMIAQAVVATRRAGAPEADPAERQVDVVGHDQQVGRDVDIGLAQRGTQGCP